MTLFLKLLLIGIFIIGVIFYSMRSYWYNFFAHPKWFPLYLVGSGGGIFLKNNVKLLKTLRLLLKLEGFFA